MNTSRGKQSPEENYERITFSPQAGFARQGGITGPKLAVKALINELAARGLSFEYVCDQSPHATIRYDTPGNPEGGGGDPSVEVPTVTWESFGNRAEIDIMEADLHGANGTVNLAAMPADLKTLLRNRINGHDIEYSAELAGADFDTLFKLIDLGVRSFRVNVPALRRSISVSSSYTAKASQANVGRIISTAALVIQENVPTSLLTELPEFVSQKPGFTYGWYKNQPSAQVVGGSKWSVTQEWDYGLWVTALHGVVL